MTTRSLVLLGVGLAACGRSAEMASPASQSRDEGAPAGGMPSPSAPPAPPMAEAEEMQKSRLLSATIGTTGEKGGAAGLDDRSMDLLLAEADGKAKGNEEAAPTRAWFPETFLFEPLVVTDAEGRAEVPVKVPDRLTTWRLLALAHDRQGHQAGALASFLGTLPVYVDPVVPPFLLAGDRVELPIQVANTTAAAWSGSVRVDVSGASQQGFQGQVSVAAGRSTVLWVPLDAPRSGELRVKVRLGEADAVERTVEVRPQGRRVEETRSGTLAAARSFEIEGPRDMDPASARVRVLVSPGALALLRRELARAEAGGGSVAADAHALLLSGAAPALMTDLGEPLDEAGHKGLRDLALRASQRVLRHARAPDTATAALLLPATAAHPDNPVLQRLTDRLADQLAMEQRPDGTFMGGGGQTVQQMLVGTAEATAAVAAAARDEAGQRRAARVQLAASAAFERHAAQVRDPYTAAAILVSGAVSGDRALALRTIVAEATTQAEDGSRILAVPEDTVRSDGSRPSEAEATALAALALAGSPEHAAQSADLAAAVLGAWSPSFGWGDGRTDLVGTRAVTTLLREPLPAEILVSVARDGVEQVRGVLSGEKRTELLVIEVPGAQALGLHNWTVAAEPAVPGLGFAWTLQTWLPWQAPVGEQGVELQLSLPERLSVGERATATLALAAPAATPLDISQPLPAGVQVDPVSLDRLVLEGHLSGYDSEDGLVTLHVLGHDATSFALAFDLVPTLAGTLHAGATLVDVPARGISLAVPGGAWGIGR